MNIEVGKTYQVNHSRKGQFLIRATKVDPEWVTGEIVSGTAAAIMHYNVRDTGEEITVRRSLCMFTEIEAKATGETK